MAAFRIVVVAVVSLLSIWLPASGFSQADDLSNWTYIGNKQSMKFHLADCEFAHLMSRTKRVHFQFRQQAIDAGMKPCNWCMPAWNLEVTGHLLQNAQ
jgi:hypothetical protein